MIDHVGIYGSRVAEGFKAFNVGNHTMLFRIPSYLNLFSSRKRLYIRQHQTNEELQKL